MEAEVNSPKGLPNLGNTCFFNSAMQCLLATHQLKYYLDEAGKDFNIKWPDCILMIYGKQVKLEKDEISVLFKKETPFIKTFKEIVTDSREDHSLNPRAVFEQVSRQTSRFRGWHQQDSHELLRYLMDGLRQEEVNAITEAIKAYLAEKFADAYDADFGKQAMMKFAKPVLDRIFGGSLLQIVRCSECHHESICFEPFLDLSLPIPRINRNSFEFNEDDQRTVREGPKEKSYCSSPLIDTDIPEGKTIQYALSCFTEFELLDGSNTYECEKCCAPENKKNGNREKTVIAKKKYLIYSLPAVLTIHIKRFEKVQRYGYTHTTKLNDDVEFPMILNLAPFCSKLTKQVAKGEEHVLYSLYGIVSHSGSLAGGHYVAYVKSRKPIEHVKKFFKNASEFDASSIGDFEKYEDIIKKFGKEESEYDEKVEKKVARESLDEGKWYYCSDSHVSSVSADQVLKTQAFLLFYERIY